MVDILAEDCVIWAVLTAIEVSVAVAGLVEVVVAVEAGGGGGGGLTDSYLGSNL